MIRHAKPPSDHATATSPLMRSAVEALWRIRECDKIVELHRFLCDALIELPDDGVLTDAETRADFVGLIESVFGVSKVVALEASLAVLCPSPLEFYQQLTIRFAHEHCDHIGDAANGGPQ